MDNLQDDRFSELRKRAEQMLEDQSTPPDDTTVTEFAGVLHELHVHQIELEMQNEELRRAQLELETSHRNYLELYDFAPVGYFTLDQTGRMIEVNLTCATLLKVARPQLIRESFSRFILPADQDIYYFFKKQLFEAISTQSCELRLNTPLNPPVYVKLDGATRMNIDGEITQAQIAMSDISVKKRAEEQVFALAVEREKVDILRTFWENATHNFRTPLTVLKSVLYLLEQQPVLEHQAHRFNMIKMQVERLIVLVENLFTLLKINEAAVLEFDYFDLNALVNIIVDDQQTLAEQHGLTCTFYPDVSLSPVWADRHYLASAISNLVINALNYTPAGGKILIHTQKRDASVEVSVEDNGIGISDTDLPHIFERFFRTNLAIHTDQHGTGLGLSITEKIIKAHRGHIEVESTLGQGSTFRICLPIKSGQPQE